VVFSFSYFATFTVRQNKLKDFQEIFEGSANPVKLKQLHKVR